MIQREESLAYHKGERPGKIELRATKPCLSPRDMRLAYLPGASFPSQEITKNQQEVFNYTSRGNLIGLITNGSAVPGLGNVGPKAAKPMMEGLAILYKRLADIEVFDLELNVEDPDSFVKTVETLESTFGAISLKDLRAPDGLYIFDRLREIVPIPIYHENLYSTAVVAMAALSNALELVEKTVEGVKIVICGAGTVGIGCARLLRSLGANPDNIFLYDINGLIHPDRDDLTIYQREFAGSTSAMTLADGLKDADIFIGASTGGVVTQDMVRTMNRFPIVFALATPKPEITYAEAKASRRDVIVATSMAQDPNAIVDLLSSPYILRGALDVRATTITDNMLLAAASALAELAREDVSEEVVRAYGNEQFTFGPEYLLPKPIDPRIFVRESSAVACQAMVDKVAMLPVEPEFYEESLTVRLGAGQETMRRLILKARQKALRVVFTEGANETILRACGILSDEGIANPILLGQEEEVKRSIDRLGLDLGGVQVIDPVRHPQFKVYCDSYFKMLQRRGVTRASAEKRLLQAAPFGAMMLDSGNADMMITGAEAHYSESMQTILEVVGTAPGIKRMSGHYMVLLPKAVYFLADCTVNIEPDAEELAETALQGARLVRSLGIEPRVAMLSFSNFGSVDHAYTRKVRCATEIIKERLPDLIVDGEMQLTTAVNGQIRQKYFPFSDLHEDANVLIFPDLQSGNLALDLLQAMGEAVLVGPVLMGSRLPAHLLQYGCSVEHVVNLTAIGVVQAAARQENRVNLM